MPVLEAVGQLDSLFCGPNATDCSSSQTLYTAEKANYVAAPLSAYVQPGSGHNLNLHVTAQQWFAAAACWLNRHFPTPQSAGASCGGIALYGPDDPASAVPPSSGSSPHRLVGAVRIRALARRRRAGQAMVTVRGSLRLPGASQRATDCRGRLIVRMSARGRRAVRRVLRLRRSCGFILRVVIAVRPVPHPGPIAIQARFAGSRSVGPARSETLRVRIQGRR